MYVTVPLMISVPFWMKTSPAITLPPGVRFASMVTIAPVPLSLQASVLARPVSPRTAHAGGACSSSCCIVSRLAGRSARRLRGMITFWPPTTIVASDQMSCGSLTVRRSISPASRAVAGRTAAPAGCAAARTAAHRARPAIPKTCRNDARQTCVSGTSVDGRGLFAARIEGIPELSVPAAPAHRGLPAQALPGPGSATSEFPLTGTASRDAGVRNPAQSPRSCRHEPLDRVGDDAPALGGAHRLQERALDRGDERGDGGGQLGLLQARPQDAGEHVAPGRVELRDEGSDDLRGARALVHRRAHVLDLLQPLDEPQDLVLHRAL